MLNVRTYTIRVTVSNIFCGAQSLFLTCVYSCVCARGTDESAYVIIMNLSEKMLDQQLIYLARCTEGQA